MTIERFGTRFSVCRRQARLTVQIPYRRPDGPVMLFIDSTGSARLRADYRTNAPSSALVLRQSYRLSPFFLSSLKFAAG